MLTLMCKKNPTSASSFSYKKRKKDESIDTQRGSFLPAQSVQIISHFTVLKDEATGASRAAGTDLVSTVYPPRTENRPAGDSHGEHQHRGSPLPSICVEASIKLPVGHFSKVKIIWQLQPVQPG